MLSFLVYGDVGAYPNDMLGGVPTYIFRKRISALKSSKVKTLLLLAFYGLTKMLNLLA
jgi:hypothetical protein